MMDLKAPEPFLDVLRRCSLDVTSFANLVASLQQSAILKGRFISVTFAATETTKTIAHGLERALQGAIVTGCSSSAVTPTALSPASDAETNITVYLNTAAPAELTVNLLVY